jgi:hypothetical protein
VHANSSGKEYKARGRLAHEGHKSKVGTSWKAIEASVCLLSWHDTKTDHPYFTGSEEVKLNAGPKSCRKCNEVIRYDSRGYAFCQCQIYNDGNSSPKKSHLDRDFLKAIKFNSSVPGAV